MYDPLEQVSDPARKGSPLNQPSNSTDFADVLTDTFTAWLESLKPALEPDKNIVSAVKEAPAAGELRFEGTLRVDCYVTGRLRSLSGTLIASETAEIESDIFVATAIIDGVMHGDIHATERVELQSHARVFGFIESPALAIQPGAVFEGQCHFLPAPFKSAGVDSVGEESLMEPVSLAPGFSPVLMMESVPGAVATGSQTNDGRDLQGSNPAATAPGTDSITQHQGALSATS
jgi:cytoskeletal protein CcmA (bactofilin family)